MLSTLVVGCGPNRFLPFSSPARIRPACRLNNETNIHTIHIAHRRRGEQYDASRRGDDDWRGSENTALHGKASSSFVKEYTQPQSTKEHMGDTTCDYSWVRTG